MKWQHSGKIAKEHLDQESKGPFELDGAQYLVRSGHYVPYYEAKGDETRTKQRRERLNIELCNRVFRISDARDLTRKPETADRAIEQLKKQYEAADGHEGRGLGRILFGRITARIRDLSREYIDQQNEEKLKQISSLYQYVMVEHPELFGCMRLFDHSLDRDGIIEEAFSEIGKPQTQSLEVIYASRAAKIGAAMAGIHQVEAVMDDVLDTIRTLPLDEVHAVLDEFAAVAARLSGFPTTDAEVYDSTAIHYVNAFDALRYEIARLDQLNLGHGRSHKLAEWLFDGINLIHSMQNIRDTRTGSIQIYTDRAQEWLGSEVRQASA